MTNAKLARGDQPMEAPRRKRNPRGQGARLRDEIIDAATALLERTGSEEAISMRGIARQVGIAAPSIAAHFKDLNGIIDAAVARELSGLHQSLSEVAASSEEPRERLHALCRAYVERARAHPASYRILVGRRYMPDWDSQNLTMTATVPLMAATVGIVTDAIEACIENGSSTSADAYFDTLILWFAIHGLATIPPAITSIAWPDSDTLLAACVTRAAQLHPSTRSEPAHPDTARN